MDKKHKNDFEQIIKNIDGLDLSEKIEAINYLREEIHNISPFKSEPVDFVKWVKNDKVGKMITTLTPLLLKKWNY